MHQDEFDEPARPDPADARDGTTRRSFLVGGTALVAATVPAALVRSQASRRAAQPAGSGYRTLADVRTEALSTAGRRLRNSPWLAYFDGQVASWNAMYISWLLRSNGMPKTASVQALYDALDARGRVGATPVVGSLIFYSAGEPDAPTHVGFVEAMGGRLPMTVEGDGPDSLQPLERFVRRYSCPWDSRVNFGYPVYG